MSNEPICVEVVHPDDLDTPDEITVRVGVIVQVRGRRTRRAGTHNGGPRGPVLRRRSIRLLPEAV